MRSQWSLLWCRILHGSLLTKVVPVYFLRNSFRPSINLPRKWSFYKWLAIFMWPMECDRDSDTLRRLLTVAVTLRGEYSKRKNQFYGFCPDGGVQVGNLSSQRMNARACAPSPRIFIWNSRSCQGIIIYEQRQRQDEG
jgi:hypothetical protein